MDFNDEFLITQSLRILQCFEACTSQSLRHRLGISDSMDGMNVAKALFQANSAILSHDIRSTKAGRENVYNYANQTALDVFERTFAEQTALASSQSVVSQQLPQSQRNNLLGLCLAKGWVQFSTERLSATGKSVRLQDAILFNLFDEAGLYCGQAVVFDPVR